LLIVWMIAGCGRLAPGEVRETPVLVTPAKPAQYAPPTVAAGAGALTPPPAPTAAPARPTPPPDFKPQAVQAAGCSYGGEFQTIEALDAYTVRFSLCAPDVTFLSKIAFPAFAIYAQEWLAQAGQPGFEVDQPVGAGPYRLEAWTRGERLTFQAFDGYWRAPAPQIRRLIFRWNLDSSARLVELQAGTAQAIDNLNPDDFATVRADSSQTLLPRPGLNVAYLGMNTRQTPLDDERVRQAIGMAIDRRSLLAAAFPAGYELADYVAPCSLPYACAGEAWWPYDPAQARERLAQAGYAQGFAIDLNYRDVVRAYLPRPDQTAQAIQAQLKENLGLTLKLRAMEETPFYTALDAGELPGLYLLGWGADYPDVSNFFDPHFGAKASLQFGGPFEDVLAAVQRGASTIDPAVRQEAYAAANAALRQHAPLVPLAHGGWISLGSQAAAFSAAVRGAQASPLGLEDFSALSLTDRDDLTWMQASEPQTLYCGAALDVETLRACQQIATGLYRYAPGGAPEPSLAEGCAPDAALQVWTCTLRPGLVFQDGSPLDANDVVTSFAIQWQTGSALHSGPDAFGYFHQFFGPFLP